MNESGTSTVIEPGAAGAPEGAVADPTTEEVSSLYKDLGIKAPVPTGKSKGRPKTTTVRAEDDAEDEAGDSSARSAKNADDKGKSKNAPASSKDGDSGNEADAKGSKKQSDSRKVQDESEEADAGVRGDKSRGEKDSERRGEEDADDGANRPGQKEGESEDSEEEGKRPGKSNPAAERRIQQLNAEKREALERAEKLEQELRAERQAKEQAKVSQDDPEYTIEDFRTVRDNSTGEIRELSPEQAELAWRRWKDGYDQRAEERQARSNAAARREEQESEMTRQVMQKSVDAYDSLAALMDDYPELVSTSGQFDEDFAADAMPIIQESIEYLEGTEPGNAEGNLPVIVGLKIHPQKILTALKNINTKKRSLPLNGLNDTVESRSNVNVPHSRSSDPTVHAANELYKELGIDKRL